VGKARAPVFSLSGESSLTSNAVSHISISVLSPPAFVRLPPPTLGNPPSAMHHLSSATLATPSRKQRNKPVPSPLRIALHL